MQNLNTYNDDSYDTYEMHMFYVPQTSLTQSLWIRGGIFSFTKEI